MMIIIRYILYGNMVRNNLYTHTQTANLAFAYQILYLTYNVRLLYNLHFIENRKHRTNLGIILIDVFLPTTKTLPMMLFQTHIF